MMNSYNQPCFRGPGAQEDTNHAGGRARNERARA